MSIVLVGNWQQLEQNTGIQNLYFIFYKVTIHVMQVLQRD